MEFHDSFLPTPQPRIQQVLERVTTAPSSTPKAGRQGVRVASARMKVTRSSV